MLGFFAGQMTAAGKVPPAKVLVIGTGVAGLAAIQTAKNMGAIVRAFDVRPVTKEQVEAMGGHFLEVDHVEDGSGTGGYAKEMSKEWHAAAARMLARQCEEVDIVITTAAIPGRAAPLMITREMVARMKSGSVTVDLAAESGGNIGTTVKDERIVTENGVTCLGYTDLASRLPTTSSSLYSNNISKFLLSMGPMTTKVKDHYYVDHADDAVRGMLAVEGGALMWPAPLPPPPATKKEDPKSAGPVVVDYRAPYVSGAKQAGYLASSCLLVGCISPDPAFSAMFTTFALSNIIGVQVVLGVAHALHSPLMAVTNAISGTTALGGMHLLAHSNSTSVTVLGALATTLSTVNIVGELFSFCPMDIAFPSFLFLNATKSFIRRIHRREENARHVQATGRPTRVLPLVRHPRGGIHGILHRRFDERARPGDRLGRRHPFRITLHRRHRGPCFAEDRPTRRRLRASRCRPRRCVDPVSAVSKCYVRNSMGS